MSSTITTASAPAGSAPPVETDSAVPRRSVSGGGSPMRTVPTISSDAGRVSVAMLVSAATTA